MSRAGVTEHLIFWHWCGGVVIARDRQQPRLLFGTLEDMFQRKLNQRQEQFFIRISSNRPVEEWAQWAVYRRLMARLPLAAKDEDPKTKPEG